VGLRKRRSSDGGRGGGDLPLVLQLGPLRRHETLGLAGSQIFAEQRARLPLGADRVPGRSRGADRAPGWGCATHAWKRASPFLATTPARATARAALAMQGQKQVKPAKVVESCDTAHASPPPGVAEPNRQRAPILEHHGRFDPKFLEEVSNLLREQKAKEQRHSVAVLISGTQCVARSTMGPRQKSTYERS